MHKIWLAILLAMIVFLFVYGLRGTLYELSLRRRNLGGVLIGIELFVFVITGVLFFELLSLNTFATFYVTEKSLRTTSILVLWSVMVLLICIAVFARLLFPRYLLAPREADLATMNTGRIAELRDLALLFLVVVTVLIQLLGVRHAFIESIFGGEELLAVRLANRYASRVPTVVMSYFSFLSAFATVTLGLSYDRLTRLGRWLRVGIVLYAVSMSGQKAPVLYAVILLAVSIISRSTALSIGRAFWLGLAGLVVLAGILFAVATVQFPGLDLVGFGAFLLNRLAVGQIQGVYEEFALNLQNSRYVLHAVPFANLFFDYSAFSKDLMMYTYGLGRAAQDVGVMNSLFIGEAFAIGGLTLLFASPVIVALNYCLLSVTLIIALQGTRTLEMTEAKRVVTLLVPGVAFFTGDISGLLMFKLNIMTLIFLFSVISVASLLRAASRTNKDADAQRIAVAH